MGTENAQIAWILASKGFTTLCPTIFPRQETTSLPNSHLSKCNTKEASEKHMNTSSRSVRCCSQVSEYTTMSRQAKQFRTFFNARLNASLKSGGCIPELEIHNHILEEVVSGSKDRNFRCPWSEGYLPITF